MRATVHWWLTGCGRRMSRLNTLVVTPSLSPSPATVPSFPLPFDSPPPHLIRFCLHSDFRRRSFLTSFSSPSPFLFPVLLSSPLLFLLSLFLSRLCSSSEGKAEPAENNSLTKDPTGFVVTFLRAPPPSSPRFHKEFIRISA